MEGALFLLLPPPSISVLSVLSLSLHFSVLHDWLIFSVSLFPLGVVVPSLPSFPPSPSFLCFPPPHVIFSLPPPFNQSISRAPSDLAALLSFFFFPSPPSLLPSLWCVAALLPWQRVIWDTLYTVSFLCVRERERERDERGRQGG